jgi:hypothetical protein
VKYLEALVTGNPTLAADPGLKTIVAAEKNIVAALALDATAAENTAVTSGTDPAATKRQALRNAFYASFWTRFTQLDELDTFLTVSGATKPTVLAAKLAAWKP